MNIEEELADIIQIPHGFKPMEKLANRMRENIENDEELIHLAPTLYNYNEYQVREVAVFLFGLLSSAHVEVLDFLEMEVSKDENWRVQENLAMAFDQYCKTTGYEKSLPVIHSWLTSENANTRRAVSEGLRIWTGRPYFKEHPSDAIQLLASLKQDTSNYVRKSCGNALRDISKKYPKKFCLN